MSPATPRRPDDSARRNRAAPQCNYAPLAPYRRLVRRLVSLRSPSLGPLSSTSLRESAPLRPGRWHPIGVCPAVYGSLDPETALAESLATHRRYKWADRDAMPRTLNAVACQFHRILNLTTGSVRQRLGVSADRMLSEAWWDRQEQDEEALTQAIGHIAWELGLEGLLVPQLQCAGGLNIVFFPDHTDPTSVLQVIHPEELPDGVP